MPRSGYTSKLLHKVLCEECTRTAIVEHTRCHRVLQRRALYGQSVRPTSKMEVKLCDNSLAGLQSRVSRGLACNCASPGQFGPTYGPEARRKSRPERRFRRGGLVMARSIKCARLCAQLPQPLPCGVWGEGRCRGRLSMPRSHGSDTTTTTASSATQRWDGSRSPPVPAAEAGDCLATMLKLEIMLRLDLFR